MVSKSEKIDYMDEYLVEEILFSIVFQFYLYIANLISSGDSKSWREFEKKV